MFSRRGGRRTDWKGATTRALAREQTECAKAMTLQQTTAAGQHTKSRDRSAHYHESGNQHIHIEWILDEAVLVHYIRRDFSFLRCCVVYSS